MVTQTDAVNRVLQILGEKLDDANGIFTTARVVSFLDEVEDNIVKGTLIDATGRFVKAGKLEFLQKKSMIETTSPNLITTDVATTDTTITLEDASFFPAAGFIEIDRDVIQYTSIIGDVLQGVTNISVSHKKGIKVTRLIPYPTDTLNFPDIVLKGEVGAMPYLDNRDQVSTIIYWTDIIDTTSTRFIKVVGQVDDSHLTLLYHQKPQGIAIANIIPDEYYLKTVPIIAAGMLIGESGEDTEGARLQSLGTQQVKMMYAYYKDKNTGFDPVIFVEAHTTLAV